MTFLSGLPLMFGGYFVSGNEVRFILPMAGIACMVVASFLVWKAENDARLKAEALVYHPIIDIRQSYLFLDPPKRKVWKAKIIPTKSVNNVQVCLDFSANSGGVGYNFWRDKRRLVLKENANFVLGAENIIDLIELDIPFWRWATNGGEPLVFTFHNCQLVFIAAQEPTDYFDFIVDFHDKVPSLISEHMFLYAQDWKTRGVEITTPHERLARMRKSFEKNKRVLTEDYKYFITPDKADKPRANQPERKQTLAKCQSTR